MSDMYRDNGKEETQNSKQEADSSKKKVFPMPTVSVDESAPVLVAGKELSIHSKVNESKEEQKIKNVCADIEKMETGRDGDDGKIVNISENATPSESLALIKSSAKSTTTAVTVGNGEKNSSRSNNKSKKTCDGDDDDEEDDDSSNVIFVDEIKNKGGAITRSKAKSVGQVDCSMSILRRRQARSPKNFRKAISEEGKLNEFQAEDLERRLKALAAAFTERTIRTKKKIQQPPTPSSEESEAEDSKTGEPTLLDRLRQLASPDPSEFGDSGRQKSLSEKVKGTFTKYLAHLSKILSCSYILDPQSSVYIGWLLIVGIVFLYNAWVIPLRVVFPYQTKSNEQVWLIFDCLADVIYLIDLLAFKPHTKFIQNGFWVKEPKETLLSYLKTVQFKLDMAALFPADIVAICFEKNYPLLRLPRILKVQTFWELFRQLDTYLAHPHRARIFHTCLYMLYMIHMVACSYYAVSTWEGIGTTTWTFDGHGNAYVRCFYFATKTATSIGKNPKPENELEYMFMTFAWLSGVFVFAILIGQIRDIIATATKSQTEYRILTSATISYLHMLGVPGRLQDRAKLWLSYTWEQQKTLDETRILNLLPKNMKAEIALNIHVETLAKVKLFQNCETAFLRDLVVKLRSIIILPGDFVCRKGEIGREMFIVKSGKIQVIGGPSGTQVLATLGEGSVFGEIALLGIGGMNKRTADVKAAGFANLFVLNKADLNDVIRDYPEAQEIMQRKAKKLMRENIKKSRASPSPATTSDDCMSLAEESGIIIKNKPEPPQLISAVLRLFPPTTKIGRYLTQGSKVSSSTDVSINSGDDDKPVDVYNTSFFTSYPPSPFIPTSPGHISQELDISIMTGDSSEKMLSPPQESQQDLISDEMTLSSEDGYRSDQLDRDSEPEKKLSLGRIENKKEMEQRQNRLVVVQNSQDEQNKKFPQVEKPTTAALSLEVNSEKLHGRCASPLPPYMRKDDTVATIEIKTGSAISDVSGGVASLYAEDSEKLLSGSFGGKEPQKSCSHYDKNREKIPIEQRPPLYIIEPDVYNLDEKRESFSSVSKKKARKGSTGSRGVAEANAVVVIDSSLEEDLAKTCEYPDKATSSSIGNIPPLSSPTTLRQLIESDQKRAKGDAASTMFTTSQFISKIRRPLRRQLEINMEGGEGSSKVKPIILKKEQESSEKIKASSYKVDLERN